MMKTSFSPKLKLFTKAEAVKSWESLQAKNYTDEKLASVIYQPLYEKKASKAIAAQYAAQLFASGEYGRGDELFKKLPPYLQRALNHLTASPSKSTTAATPSDVGAGAFEGVPA